MSILHDELQAAGFIRVATPVEGAEAWTNWRRPAPELPVYERYYELVKRAMYAQVNLRLAHRIGCRPLTCKSLMREFATVVDCWRSASSVAPPADWPGGDPEICQTCGCDRGFCGGPMHPDDPAECDHYDAELGEPTC